MAVRDNYIHLQLTRLLERLTPPRNFAENEEAKITEIQHMARVLWREAPLQGYEEWWGKFEGYLLENHQSRAWPIVGQIVKACQAVSGPKSIRNFNDTSVFEFKYQRVLDYFLKHKAPAPYYNEPEITSRLIKEGYLSDEREARFFGFALDEEANKKVHSQRPGKDEWNQHIRVLCRINDLDEATIIDRELRELSHGEIPEHLLHLVRRKGVADQDEDLE